MLKTWTDGKREAFEMGAPGWNWKARHNKAARVYDRLRKRSYRRRGWPEWLESEHRAYVMGVKDAIAEMLK